MLLMSGFEITFNVLEANLFGFFLGRGWLVQSYTAAHFWFNRILISYFDLFHLCGILIEVAFLVNFFRNL